MQSVKGRDQPVPASTAAETMHGRVRDAMKKHDEAMAKNKFKAIRKPLRVTDDVVDVLPGIRDLFPGNTNSVVHEERVVEEPRPVSPNPFDEHIRAAEDALRASRAAFAKQNLAVQSSNPRKSVSPPRFKRFTTSHDGAGALGGHGGGGVPWGGASYENYAAKREHKARVAEAFSNAQVLQTQVYEAMAQQRAAKSAARYDARVKEVAERARGHAEEVAAKAAFVAAQREAVMRARAQEIDEENARIFGDRSIYVGGRLVRAVDPSGKVIHSATAVPGAGQAAPRAAMPAPGAPMGRPQGPEVRGPRGAVAPPPAAGGTSVTAGATRAHLGAYMVPSAAGSMSHSGRWGAPGGSGPTDGGSLTAPPHSGGSTVYLGGPATGTPHAAQYSGGIPPPPHSYLTMPPSLAPVAVATASPAARAPSPPGGAHAALYASMYAAAPTPAMATSPHAVSGPSRAGSSAALLAFPPGASPSFAVAPPMGGHGAPTVTSAVSLTATSGGAAPHGSYVGASTTTLQPYHAGPMGSVSVSHLAASPQRGPGSLGVGGGAAAVPPPPPIRTSNGVSLDYEAAPSGVVVAQLPPAPPGYVWVDPAVPRAPPQMPPGVPMEYARRLSTVQLPPLGGGGGGGAKRAKKAGAPRTSLVK